MPSFRPQKRVAMSPYLRRLVALLAVVSTVAEAIIRLPGAAASVSESTANIRGDARCEEITIPMCRGIGYNLTFMPNQFNHESQDEAGLEVHQFWPLVEIQCSSDLKLFLCSMYAPICIEDYHQNLPACRSVCERAKAGCSPLMRQYGFAWPERMNCDRLPTYGDPHQLCMDSKNGSEVSSSHTNKYKGDKQQPTPSTSSAGSGRNGGATYRKTQTTGGRHPNKDRPGGPGSGGVISGSPSSGGASRDFPIMVVPGGSGGKSEQTEIFRPTERSHKGSHKGVSDQCQCNCHHPLVAINESSSLFNKVSTGGQANCAIACHGAYFSPGERHFAAVFIVICSVLCCLSTAVTVATFLIDMPRFKYPERPIVFLSACYMMVSVGHLVPVVLGRSEVACESATTVSRYSSSSGGPATCTVVFLLVYFFGMASAIWWVVLAFTWFLAAALKWGNEAIASYSQYFHLAAWLVPSVKTIAVLAVESVDADPLLGICTVGNHDLEAMRGFVLAPLFVYLLLGSSFLLAGFVALFRIRNVIKQQGRARTDKLEKLMIRIGLSSFVYAVSATFVVGFLFYEQHWRPLWERSLTCPCQSKASPMFTLFMFKYFMGPGVGITSGLWVLSGKTLDSWRRFKVRICGGTLPPRVGGGGCGVVGGGGNCGANGNIEAVTTPQLPMPPPALTLQQTPQCRQQSFVTGTPRLDPMGGSLIVPGRTVIKPLSVSISHISAPGFHKQGPLSHV